MLMLMLRESRRCLQAVAVDGDVDVEGSETNGTARAMGAYGCAFPALSQKLFPLFLFLLARALCLRLVLVLACRLSPCSTPWPLPPVPVPWIARWMPPRSTRRRRRSSTYCCVPTRTSARSRCVPLLPLLSLVVCARRRASLSHVAAPAHEWRRPRKSTSGCTMKASAWSSAT